eukprot:1924214-Rhodomonas_salina.6
MRCLVLTDSVPFSSYPSTPSAATNIGPCSEMSGTAARCGANRRIGAIRDALDSEVPSYALAMPSPGFTDVSIVAYTAKYASAFYGNETAPFRAPRALCSL